MIWQKNTQFHSLAIQLNITGYITTRGLAISKKSKTSTTPWQRPMSLIYTGRHERKFSHTYNQLLTLKKEQKHTKHNRNGHNWLLLELHFDGIQNLQWHMQIKWTYVNSHRKYGSAPQLSRKQTESSNKTISVPLANNRIIWEAWMRTQGIHTASVYKTLAIKAAQKMEMVTILKRIL